MSKVLVAALSLALAACGGGKDGKAYCKTYADKMADLGTAGMAPADKDNVVSGIRAGSLQRCKDGAISKEVAECVTAAADSAAAARCMK